MRVEAPYLVFIGDAKDALAAKTGQGIVDWRRDKCLGQLRLPGCRADLGIPEMTIAEAASRGARSFVIGTVSPGGVLPDFWGSIIVDAIEHGMDIASGLHTRLEELDAVRAAAARCDRRLIDVRHPRVPLATGSGAKRSGKRLLTVGTDC